MNYSINLRIHNRLKKRWKWLRVAYEDWCANILPFYCKMHSYIWLKQPHKKRHNYEDD